MNSTIPFTPPLFGGNPHFQTVSGHLLSVLPGYVPDMRGLLNESAILPTQDGAGDKLYLHIHRFTREEKAHGAVVLVHGAEGSSDAIYVVKLTDKLLQAGFHVVRMNLRSCGKGYHLARHLYNAGLTIDLETVLEYVYRNVSKTIALVGFSLGANIVLKYLGEDRAERNRQRAVFGAPPVRGRIHDNRVAVFVAVSPPLDLYSSCEYIDSLSARSYRKMFLNSLKERLSSDRFLIPFDDHAEIPHIQTWFDFDHLVTARLAGFIGAIEYYQHCSSRHYVKHVKIPGLVLHARDDPLINPVGWEETNWEALPHITAHLTKKGGHVGWLAKRHPFFWDRRWMDYRIMAYLLDWLEASKSKKNLFPGFTKEKVLWANR